MNDRLLWGLALALASICFFASAAPALVLCPRIEAVTLGDKRVEIAWTLPDTLGRAMDERDIPEVYGVEFGGYRVWMREVWKGEDFELIRVFEWGQSDTGAAGYWDLPAFYQDSVRVFVNDEVHNGFPYMFSVTAFEAGADTVNQVCQSGNSSGVVYPTVAAPNNLDSIQTIPNPYRSSADWEYGGQRRILFVGLPTRATIRLYTASGTLVRTIDHYNPDGDQDEWDLRNADGEDIAPGIYIWAVESEGIGSATGKMMIIK
jgi:hypothetical protein